jgi:hypothetical protein
MGNAKRIHFPKTRLAELAARPGGPPRDIAIEGALKSLESMRGESDNEIVKSIAAMEKAVFDPANKGKLTDDQMVLVLRGADQIVTLAGTFGYAALDVAARSLCDVADGLLQARMHDIEPIAVHVQSLRIVAPGGPKLSEENVVKILEELAKVNKHFNFAALGDQDEVGTPTAG